MAITFDEDSIAIKDGTPLIIPRDANFDTMALMGGFDSSNTFKFAQFTNDGLLKVDAVIELGEVHLDIAMIKVLGPTGAEVLVSGDYNPDATTVFMYTQDQRMGFTGTSLQVDVTGSELPAGAATDQTLRDILETLGGGSQVGKIARFDSKDISPNGVAPTTILDYPVPASTRFKIDSVRGWADVDAEFCVAIDGVQVDGYRTTPAELTMNIESASIQYATAGQHVTIAATHFKSGSDRKFKAVLQGALETV